MIIMSMFMMTYYTLPSNNDNNEYVHKCDSQISLENTKTQKLETLHSENCTT